MPIKRMQRSIAPKWIDSGLDKTYLNQVDLPNNALLLSPSEKFRAILSLNTKQQARRAAHYAENTKKDSHIAKSNVTYFSENNNANLGWSLHSADINNDRSLDLIMGAPVYSDVNIYQNGAVFVMLNQNGSGLTLENVNVEKEADIIVRPPSGCTRSRFGHSTVVLDLNQDGVNDLVVGAPSFNLENIIYEVFRASFNDCDLLFIYFFYLHIKCILKGRVYVYLSKNNRVDYTNPALEITCKSVLHKKKFNFFKPSEISSTKTRTPVQLRVPF